jgi:mono/diheme cytochrome c family protein
MLMKIVPLAAFGLMLNLVMPTTQASAQNAEEGAALFQWYCASCHGINADGAGPMAPVLLVQPTDLTALSAASGGVFPIVRVMQRIDGRDQLVSHGSQMPVYGPVFQGDDVALKTPSGQPVLMGRSVADLVLYLQEIQK